jgi:hypothetical protein
LHQNKVKQQIPNIFQSKYQQKLTGSNYTNNYTDKCAENIGLLNYKELQAMCNLLK